METPQWIDIYNRFSRERTIFLSKGITNNDAASTPSLSVPEALLRKLGELAEQFEQLNTAIQDPELFNNPDAARVKLKEHGRLKPMVEAALDWSPHDYLRASPDHRTRDISTATAVAPCATATPC